MLMVHQNNMLLRLYKYVTKNTTYNKVSLPLISTPVTCSAEQDCKIFVNRDSLVLTWAVCKESWIHMVRKQILRLHKYA